MARRPGTDKDGQPFSDEIKKAVWNKAGEFSGFASEEWRVDKCDRLICWEDFNNRNSINGWEIDHIKPVGNGGTDDLANLQPLQWSNNEEKGDREDWDCW